MESVTVASTGIWSVAAGRLLLILHLLVAVFALGAVTHHFWSLLAGKAARTRLAKHVKWMAISYPLVWLMGVLIYPSYNVLIRKPPVGVLEQTCRWAVGLFEIKEHVGSIALVMLPWLVLSARRIDRLSRPERISYVAATWVFTLFVYYAFVSGTLVTAIKSF